MNLDDNDGLGCVDHVYEPTSQAEALATARGYERDPLAMDVALLLTREALAVYALLKGDGRSLEELLGNAENIPPAQLAQEMKQV
ncbi:MAG: hypothetical protein V1926_03450 [Candidatus Peregrinibacteria bacterium]